MFAIGLDKSTRVKPETGMIGEPFNNKDNGVKGQKGKIWRIQILLLEVRATA
jgi:hypothetical protein